MFETDSRRTIECATRVYSFGQCVFDIVQVEQALWIARDEYVYRFQLADAFMNILLHQLMDESNDCHINNALTNLVIVQVNAISGNMKELGIPNSHIGAQIFQDLDQQASGTNLLVMIYQLERGFGQISTWMLPRNKLQWK